MIIAVIFVSYGIDWFAPIRNDYVLAAAAVASIPIYLGINWVADEIGSRAATKEVLKLRREKEDRRLF